MRGTLLDDARLGERLGVRPVSRGPTGTSPWIPHAMALPSGANTTRSARGEEQHLALVEPPHQGNGAGPEPR